MALQHASPAMQDNDEVVFLPCKTVVFRRCLQLLQSGVVDERWKDVEGSRASGNTCFFGTEPLHFLLPLSREKHFLQASQV